jgi:lysophospholipase L1-like esterase
MKIAPQSRLVMIGDSVTDCGRFRPVGEGSPEALGHGYVLEVDTHLRAFLPAHRIRVTNMGIGGNTVRDLLARWQTDVLALRPDWLSVMIGINDVWRYFDPDRSEEAVLPDEFENIYDKLLSVVRPQLQGLVLLTPFFIEPRRAEPMRARMDAYGAIVARVAARHGALLVDTQAAFDRVLAHVPSSALAPDRVHPNHVGHLVLAGAFLNAIGFTGAAPSP